MRLAYLVSRHPAVNHAFMLREIRALRRLGFEVRVASIGPPDRPPEALTAEEREEAASTFYVKRAGAARIARAHLATLARRPGRYFAGLWHALRLGPPRRALSHCFYFAEAVVVGDWMRRRGLSHVHVHYSSTVGLLAARIFPVTMSVTLHGSAEFNDPVGFRVAEKVRASLFTRAISSFGRSQIMQATAPEDWPRLEVSYLGVDTAVFAPAPFRERPAPFRIASVGSLDPVKGHPILLEALETLVRGGRDVRLEIAGDGPRRAALERDAARRGLADRVVFHGFLNQDRLRALYRSSDALAMASFAEGLPVVLMEAMAMEIPCVAPWIAGIPELIEPGVHGLLVAPSDAPALARALAALVDSPELRRRLGQAARRRVLDEFDLDRNTARLAEIFRRRLGGAQAATGSGA